MGPQGTTAREELHIELPAALQRAKAIARRAEREDAGDLVELVLAELGTALEELGVAVAELTDQQAAMDAVRAEMAAAARRNRVLFDAAPDAVLLTDGHGIVQHANEAAQRLLGKEERWLRGKPVASLLAESNRRCAYDLLARLREGEDRVEGRIALLLDPEEPRTVVIAVTGFPGDEALHWQMAGALPPPRRRPLPARAPAAAEPDSAGLAEELATARTLTAQLQRALDTRIVVEQAKGLLAERHGISPEEAWERLRRRARSTGSKVHDLVEAVIAGEVDLNG